MSLVSKTIGTLLNERAAQTQLGVLFFGVK